MPKFCSQWPLSSSAPVDLGSAACANSLVSTQVRHIFGNASFGKKFSVVVRLISPVLLISAFAIAPALGQTAGGLPASGIASAGVSPAMQPGVIGVAPAGIPLGSSELQTHGESPAIIRPGITAIPEAAPLVRPAFRLARHNLRTLA
jgi:hypothetical protein